MRLTVRQTEPPEARLIIDYFHSSTPEHLEMMGVDPTRLPEPGRWLATYEEDARKPLAERDFLLVVWEVDGEPVGFSTADTITFGRRARMHLHIVDPDRRRAGLGVRCVRETARGSG